MTIEDMRRAKSSSPMDFWTDSIPAVLQKVVMKGEAYNEKKELSVCGVIQSPGLHSPYRWKHIVHLPHLKMETGVGGRGQLSVHILKSGTLFPDPQHTPPTT